MLTNTKEVYCKMLLYNLCKIRVGYYLVHLFKLVQNSSVRL